MPTRIVFEDSNNNQMDVFINKDNDVFIGINASYMEAYITLNKEDLIKLIDLLQTLEKEM